MSDHKSGQKEQAVPLEGRGSDEQALLKSINRGLREAKRGEGIAQEKMPEHFHVWLHNYLVKGNNHRQEPEIS